MTTAELIEAVRALVKEYGAVEGNVTQAWNISRSPTDGTNYSQWGAQVWFCRPRDSRGAANECACIAYEGSPEEVLVRLRAKLESIQVDPILTNEVLPDEIDEDPEDDSEHHSLEAASSTERNVLDHERDQREASEQ